MPNLNVHILCDHCGETFQSDGDIPPDDLPAEPDYYLDGSFEHLCPKCWKAVEVLFESHEIGDIPPNEWGVRIMQTRAWNRSLDESEIDAVHHWYQNKVSG